MVAYCQRWQYSLYSSVVFVILMTCIMYCVSTFLCMVMSLMHFNISVQPIYSSKFIYPTQLFRGRLPFSKSCNFNTQFSTQAMKSINFIFNIKYILSICLRNIVIFHNNIFITCIAEMSSVHLYLVNICYLHHWYILNNLAHVLSS